jgi:hypothetical protein
MFLASWYIYIYIYIYTFKIFLVLRCAVKNLLSLL